MAASDCQAAIVLIDNSFTSINGDFIPTRIEAEKNTVEVFSRYFIRGNKESVFGFGTLSDFDFGINTSLTQELRKIRMNLDTVKVGGKVQLEKAIRCGLFALKHRPKEVPNRKLIILLSSQHELTNEKADILAALANKEGACIDIIVFGGDEINRETLKFFVDKLGNKSYYSEIPVGVPVLSDAVLQKYMSNFNTAMPPASADDFNFNDDDLQRAIEMSRQDAGIPGGDDDIDDVDPELQAALRESRIIQDEDQQQEEPPAPPPQPAQAAPPPDNLDLDEDDPELLAAIQESMKNIDDDDNDDKMEDPELREAMLLSQKVLDDDEEENKKLAEDINNLIDSPDALKDVLSEFSGIDTNDPRFNPPPPKETKDENPKKQ